MKNMQGRQSSVEKYLQHKALDKAITEKIQEQLSPLQDENEKLQQENKELKNQVNHLKDNLQQKEEKFGTVRQQLQMLNYIIGVGKLKEGKAVEQLGTFFGRLFNRHPQRVRKQFSSYGKLLYSSNKAEAELILKDLRIVQKSFVDFGEKATVKRIQKDIDKLTAKHFSEKL